MQLPSQHRHSVSPTHLPPFETSNTKEAFYMQMHFAIILHFNAMYICPSFKTECKFKKPSDRSHIWYDTRIKQPICCQHLELTAACVLIRAGVFMCAWMKIQLLFLLCILYCHLVVRCNMGKTTSVSTHIPKHMITDKKASVLMIPCSLVCVQQSIKGIFWDPLGLGSCPIGGWTGQTA